MLHCNVLYHVVLHCSMLSCIVLNCIVLCCVLYCIVSDYIIIIRCCVTLHVRAQSRVPGRAHGRGRGRELEQGRYHARAQGRARVQGRDRGRVIFREQENTGYYEVGILFEGLYSDSIMDTAVYEATSDAKQEGARSSA